LKINSKPSFPMQLSFVLKKVKKLENEKTFNEELTEKKV
jgi:hypothetical protein